MCSVCGRVVKFCVKISRFLSLIPTPLCSRPKLNSHNFCWPARQRPKSEKFFSLWQRLLSQRLSDKCLRFCGMVSKAAIFYSFLKPKLLFSRLSTNFWRFYDSNWIKCLRLLLLQPRSLNYKSTKISCKCCVVANFKALPSSLTLASSPPRLFL